MGWTIHLCRGAQKASETDQRKEGESGRPEVLPAHTHIRDSTATSRSPTPTWKSELSSILTSPSPTPKPPATSIMSSRAFDAQRSSTRYLLYTIPSLSPLIIYILQSFPPTWHAQAWRSTHNHLSTTGAPVFSSMLARCRWLQEPGRVAIHLNIRLHLSGTERRKGRTSHPGSLPAVFLILRRPLITHRLLQAGQPGATLLFLLLCSSLSLSLQAQSLFIASAESHQIFWFDLARLSVRQR